MECRPRQWHCAQAVHPCPGGRHSQEEWRDQAHCGRMPHMAPWRSLSGEGFRSGGRSLDRRGACWGGPWEGRHGCARTHALVRRPGVRRAAWHECSHPRH
eukprot:11974394-Alexandrium_andersonii.AAC.1